MSIEIPNLLSLTGSVDPSHGLFFSSKNGENEKPLPKESVGVLGTLGSYSELKKMKTKDEFDEVHGNPQKVDVCFLPPNHNNLHVKGNIKFTNQINSINSNDPTFIDSLNEIYFNYAYYDEFKTIIFRYLTQMLNGSVLFRNRYSPDIKLILSYQDGNKNLRKKQFEIDQDYTFNNIDWFQNDGFLFEIYSHVKNAFMGAEKDVFLLTYEYIIDMGYGQEVYPSQEFLENDEGKKVLFETFYENNKIAGMHSQKIGNALRTIDDWYSDNQVSPIPVDPFGPDKKRSLFRRKKQNHIYQILDDVVKDHKNGNKIHYNSNNMHYLMASLLRGGVYSGEKKK